MCKAYFGGEFDENNIRKHFVLIYEILDEVMDYGIPQLVDADLLKKVCKSHISLVFFFSLFKKVV